MTFKDMSELEEFWCVFVVALVATFPRLLDAVRRFLVFMIGYTKRKKP
jgi:hypothetical protein